MAITIGRLGYAGFGLEGTPGTPVAAGVYLPYTDISMRGHHEPLEVQGATTSRNMDKDSVVGKKWSEGDLKIDLDVVNSGYLFKMALGNEVLATGTPNNHTFYATVSGNTPKTATVIFGRDTDVEQYSFVACDELSMEVSDGLGTLSASMRGKFPTVGATQTVTTTSGTVFSFKDMAVQFGTTLTTATSASATELNEISLSVANNVEVIHRSGSADVSTIRTKGMKVSGSYTVFFDSETDKNAYYNLSKRAMIITFTGNANEQLRIRIPRFRLSEGEISTGLEDFFVLKGSFVAEDIVDSGCRLMDVRLQNDKSTVY